MSSQQQPSETPGGTIPDGLAEAGIYQTEREGFDHGLVVLAMGRPFWLVPAGASFRLLVEPETLAAVHEQLASFDRESVGWPPQPAPATGAIRETDFVTPLLWVIALLAVFRAQVLWPGRCEAMGALDAEALFRRGEWWRPATALFLHADAGHLLSNALFGLFVFSSVVATLGRKRGWVLLAISSIGGNVAAAALRHPGRYESLGASTAVFAGLGLLTGRAVRAALAAENRHGWRAVFVPLASGLILLALYGTGGAGVDAGAHATGFGAGLALGLLTPSKRDPAPQKV